MSTTFEVFTPTTNIPSFNDVLLLSNRYLAEALEKNGIDKKFTIDVLLINGTILHGIDSYIDFEKSSPALWQAENTYAWFYVPGEAGGCDAHRYDVYPLDLECWEGEFESNPRSKNMEPFIRKCLNVGFYWSFRRSIGQPCIVNLSYGLIAAAFATLTNGFIFSDDNAWDYGMFPTDSENFLLNYFNPNYPHPEHSKWAYENLENIRLY